MNNDLRILLLEDSLADAKLIERELFQEGFCFSLARAQTESELRHELFAAPPDLVLSNHRLSGLGGLEALAIVREMCPQVPFIFVSGSIDQQMVCDMYAEGANDYVFKHDLQELQAAVAKATGVKPGPVAASPGGEVRQAELLPQWFIPRGVLSLCPNCHRARDENGQVVPIEDYCDHRVKSLIIRQLCDDCSRVASNSSKASGPKSAKLQPAVH